jgi:7-keto-8-aminopelargonate synthetase-like enzyme
LVFPFSNSGSLRMYSSKAAEGTSLKSSAANGTAAIPKRLLERGINVQPVTHPAVPAKASRLRFFLTAMHTEAEMAEAIETTAEELGQVRGRMRTLGPLS